ncbi:MAG: hypothetical protein M3040_03090, partial [Bacteroidota bacterium]|nr:hypothetical protein [Bacteroidota bacterium]
QTVFKVAFYKRFFFLSSPAKAGYFPLFQYQVYVFVLCDFCTRNFLNNCICYSIVGGANSKVTTLQIISVWTGTVGTIGKMQATTGN